MDSSRFVPAMSVQLEDAQLRIEQLEAQVAELQREVDRLKAAAAQPAATGTTATGPAAQTSEQPLLVFSSGAELIHWSTAWAAVLRHNEEGQWMHKDRLLEALQSSKRYGRLTSEGLYSLITQPNQGRFQISWMAAWPGGQESWHVRATPGTWRPRQSRE